MVLVIEEAEENCAFAEMSAITLERPLDERPRLTHVSGTHRRLLRPWLHGDVCRRIRTLLATAGDADYREAVERPAGRAAAGPVTGTRIRR